MGHPVSATTRSTTDQVRIKRAYAPADDGDGYRVLVDRLWARGVSKEKAHLDAWMKEIAPSTELRRWFGHDPARWDEFQRRYRAELAEPERRQLVEALAERATHGPVTLIYGARDTAHNEAVVLCAVVSAARATHQKDARH
jgi:uncharacterized protein YeaO (DUF488 family)